MYDNLKERLTDMSVLASTRTPADALKYIEELEANLEKAVEVAEKSIKWLRLYGADVHREAATLAELTGGKDE